MERQSIEEHERESCAADKTGQGFRFKKQAFWVRDRQGRQSAAFISSLSRTLWIKIRVQGSKAGEFRSLGCVGRTVPFTGRYGCAGPTHLRLQPEGAQFQRETPARSVALHLAPRSRSLCQLVSISPQGSAFSLGLSPLCLWTLDPIARSRTQLGTRGLQQRRMGRRPEADSSLPHFAKIMQITLKIPHPTLLLNLASCWHVRHVHQVSTGLLEWADGELLPWKRARRVPFPSTHPHPENPKVPQGNRVGKKAQEPCIENPPLQGDVHGHSLRVGNRTAVTVLRRVCSGNFHVLGVRTVLLICSGTSRDFSNLLPSAGQTL